MTKLAAFIISSGRAGNVPAMAKLTAGLRPVWVVPRGQEAAYRKAGAARVAAVRGGLSAQRNAALDLAGAAGAWCVQLDDDLRGVRWVQLDGGCVRSCAAAWAAAQIADTMAATGARLGGVAPTTNAYFTRRAVTSWGFVRSALAVLVPGPERYDPRLKLKEDWDMTCQHLAAYGRVARRDDLLADFAFSTGAGGANAYRTPDLEAASCALLLARWPQLLRPHARRDGELALKPGPAAVQQPGEAAS